MRITRTIVATLAAVTLIGGGLAVTAQATNGPSRTAPATAGTAAGDVSQLAFHREEERMARDLYQHFADTYDDARPFGNITRSEQMHFDAVGTLLTTYDVADPSEGMKAGTYAYPELQDLYDGWVEQGDAGLRSAYRAAIALEKRDIADLKATIPTFTQDDISTVLEHLLFGSENHLRAFRNALDGKAFGQGGHRNGKGRMGPRGRGGRGGWDRGRMGQGPMGQGRMGQGPGAGSGDCPMMTSRS